MSQQNVFDYVMNTPNNTNPVILRQMLKDAAGSGNLQLDTTLTVAGAAADAAAVGEAIGRFSSLTDEDALALLVELGIVTPILTSDNKIITDSQGKICSL